MRERKNISDDKIYELYMSGWSINDIVRQHRTSVRRVREILQSKGVETSKYRNAPDIVKECVLLLIGQGFSLRRTADTLDISTHLVRQILRDNQTNAENLRLAWKGNQQDQSFSREELWAFSELYISGQLGFIKCAEAMGLKPRACVLAANGLNIEDISKHKTGLRVNILSKQKEGLSAITIGKQLGVSAAIVKEILKNA